MRAPQLDFLRSTPRPTWLAYVLLLLGVAMGVGSLLRYVDAREANAGERLRATNASNLQPKRAGIWRVNPNPTGTNPSGVKAATDDAQAMQEVRWDVFLAGLEHSRPRKIAFLAIEADARKREALLTLEAPEPRYMLDYIEGLRRMEGFSGVVLISHGVEVDSPNQPLQFVMRMHWGAI